MFIDLPLTIFTFIILLSMSKTLFTIPLLILMFYLIILFCYHKKLNNGINNYLQNKADITSFMTESIRGFETIKGLNIENKIIRIFDKKYTKYIRDNIQLNKIQNRQNTFKNIINVFGSATIIIVGINLVKSKTISLSLLITYNILTSFFLEPIKNIISLDFEIKEATNAIKRILDLTDFKQRQNKTLIKGDISIKNLYFSFDEINYTLKGINLQIKENSKVLITGQSGSGKSTLLKIIKGYYRNYKGQIIIKDKQIDYPLNITYISSKETIFTGTLKHNLAIKGSNNLKTAIEICNIDEIINENSLGYNTLLEENGFNLSDGQKQRIALARSLYKFNILLIDEGLSNLDVNME